jgi:hypothetical protein
VVQEVILAEELERNLHSPNRQDMSAELDKAPTHADRINGEHVVEAKQL